MNIFKSIITYLPILAYCETSYGKIDFRHNIKIKNPFINAHTCSEGEFKSVLNKEPLLFKSKDLIYEGHCPTIAEDRLEIEVLENKDLKVSLETNFFNGHQCSLVEEIFKKIGKKFIFQKNELGTKYKRDFCTIELRVEGNNLKFQVQNKFQEGGCNLFCGARGSLDNTTFVYNN